MLYCSRIVPNGSKNESNRLKKAMSISRVPLRKVDELELCVKQAGQIDNLHLQQIAAESHSLEPDILEIEVKAVSLNAKDMYMF